MSTWKTRVAKAMLVVVSVVVTVAVADLALRAVGYLPRVDHDWLLSPAGQFRKPDDALVLIHPKFESDEFYRIDPSLETVITLGDSFTEGYPVAEADNLAGVLQQLLAKDGRAVNMLNMGLGNSGTDQQLRLLKERLLPEVIPNVVVWTLYSNDLVDNWYQSAYKLENETLVPADGSKHWLYQRQALYDRIPASRERKAASPVLRLLLRAFGIFRKRDRPEHGPADERRSMAKALLAIDEMERLAKIHDFEIVFALIAPQALYLDSTEPRNEFEVGQWLQLQSMLAERGPFADASFVGSTASACGLEFDLPDDITPAWSTLFINDGRDANILGHRHFNETGYRILAGMVATCLGGKQTQAHPGPTAIESGRPVRTDERARSPEKF